MCTKEIIVVLFNIPGMWSTSFYLGNFVGPTGAGVLVDNFGFRSTTIVFFGIYTFILLVDFIELGFSIRINRKVSKEGYEELT